MQQRALNVFDTLQWLKNSAINVHRKWYKMHKKCTQNELSFYNFRISVEDELIFLAIVFYKRKCDAGDAGT